MDSEGQVAENEGTEDTHGPPVRVARSGTLYVELDELVPYFLPTDEKVRSYIEDHGEEVRSYIQETRCNMGKLSSTDEKDKTTPTD
jgi:hypothetical protein